MAGTQEIAVERIAPAAGIATRPMSDGFRRRLALTATIAVAALGAAAFGVFTLSQSSGDQSHGEAAGVKAAEASGARFNAQAEYYAAGGAGLAQINPAGRPEAIEAYGRRWEALFPTISPAAIEAYGARWSALGERFRPPMSQAAIDAYGARWTALAAASF